MGNRYMLHQSAFSNFKRYLGSLQSTGFDFGGHFVWPAEVIQCIDRDIECDIEIKTLLPQSNRMSQCLFAYRQSQFTNQIIIFGQWHEKLGANNAVRWVIPAS